MLEIDGCYGKEEGELILLEEDDVTLCFGLNNNNLT